MAEEKKKRLVVLRKTKGENPKGEEFVPGLPVFKRGVPIELPERTAKELIERAGDKKFRMASEAEVMKFTEERKAAERAKRKAEKEAAKAKTASKEEA